MWSSTDRCNIKNHCGCPYPAVSHAHLENLDGYDHAHKTLHLSPTLERDVYCAEILMHAGKGTGLVCVHRGTCYVNGEEVREGDKPRKVKNGLLASAEMVQPLANCHATLLLAELQL